MQPHEYELGYQQEIGRLKETPPYVVSEKITKESEGHRQEKYYAVCRAASGMRTDAYFGQKPSVIMQKLVEGGYDPHEQRFQKGTEIPEPVVLADDAITRFNHEGMRQGWKSLEIVDECREALGKVPQGKRGLVLGPGQNNASWKERGWETLDIDPQYGADHTVDANWMETVIPDRSLDFVCAENIRMHPTGEEGVGWARVLEQANKALKPGGKIVIESASFESSPGPTLTLPNRRHYAELMTAHGFEVVVEVTDLVGDPKAQRVYYFGEKVKEEYDPTRSPKNVM